MTHPTDGDYSLIKEACQLASRREVSLTFNFEAGCETFYVSISSAAPSECWVGKSTSSPEGALRCAIEWMRKLRA